MQRGFVMLAALCLARSVCGNETPAEDKTGSSVERLLTLAGQPSAKNLLAARQYYRSLPHEIGHQRHVRYAYLLALIHQRKFQEASDLTNEMVEGPTRDLALWRAKIWLELSIGNQSAAMNDLERLTARSAACHGMAEPELAEFFGAASGFLSGPCSQKVRAADAQSLANRLRASLTADSRVLFDNAKKGLLERYRQLRGEYDQRAHKDLALRSAQLDAARNAVARTAQEVGEKQLDLKAKRDSRASESKLILDDFDKQIKAIEQKRQPLLKQIATLEAEQLALVSQLLPETTMPSSRSNAAVELAIINHNRPIRQVLASVVAKLTTLAADDAALRLREQELLLSRAAAQNKYAVELGKIEQQSRSLDKNGKRIEYKAKRINVRPVGVGPRLSTEARQLTRFSTYVPFPFERERQRLLEVSSSRPS